MQGAPETEETCLLILVPSMSCRSPITIIGALPATIFHNDLILGAPTHLLILIRTRIHGVMVLRQSYHLTSHENKVRDPWSTCIRFRVRAENVFES